MSLNPKFRVEAASLGKGALFATFFGCRRVVGIATVFFVLFSSAVLAQQISVLNVSPSNPAGGLVEGLDGNLYGASFAGGTYGLGTVFEVTPAGALTVVASFDGTNGADPRGTLVADGLGNLYGVAYGGGASNAGTVFKVTQSGQLGLLHSFGGDTSNPYGGLIAGGDGSFYGTTETFASVFRISPGGVYTNLTSYFGKNGYALDGGLATGMDGAFYGLASLRNFSPTNELIFRMTADGNVASIAQFGTTNGEHSYGGLVLGNDGLFYGTSTGGGFLQAGTAFSITTNGAINQLMNFSDSSGSCPFAPLLVSSDGSIYGSTLGGGNYGKGTIFILDPATNGTLAFSDSFAGTNGEEPDGKLLQASNGIFYGTTRLGGSSGNGTVFQFAPGEPVTLLASFGVPPATQPSPALQIGLTAGQIVLSWPVPIAGAGYQLQKSGDLTDPNGWVAVSDMAQTNGTQMTLSLTNTGINMFYRLKQP